MEPVHVIGAGGHAKVVVSTLQAAGFPVAACYDDDPKKRGAAVLGVPVAGTLSDFARLPSPRAVIAVGENHARMAIARRFPGARWVMAVHPGAIVHETVRLGPGTVVFAGAVIQPGAVLGAHCIVNTAASIDHDCALGDFCHVAPGCALAGGVTLGEGVFLGIGCAAVPGARVGEWAVVGAGGVIVSPIPPRVVAVGVPARPVRDAAPPEATGEPS